jgi:hypothetical protein
MRPVEQWAWVEALTGEFQELGHPDNDRGAMERGCADGERVAYVSIAEIDPPPPRRRKARKA